MAIVAASGDGNAPSTTANKVNDGATVLHGGNVDTNAGIVTRNFQMTETTDGVPAKSIGSKVYEIGGSGAATTDRAGTTKAVAAGTIAYTMTANNWLIVGGNHTTTIGGVANTIMQGGNTDFNGQQTTRSSIQSTLSTYKLGEGGGTFDVYAVPSTDITPNYTKGSNAGSLSTHVAPSGGGIHAATDDAANPTAAVPGELTYMDGSAEPITDEYQARDSANSV